MKLVNNDCLKISVTESLVLSDYIADPTRITGIRIKGIYNETEYVKDYPLPFPECDDEEGFVECNDGFYIKPELFDLTGKLPDGVYTITLTGIYVQDNIQVSELACIYIDCETKCKVLETGYVEAMMYHYTLNQSYTCNCNCDKLFEIWEALQHILTKNTICDKC